MKFILVIKQNHNIYSKGTIWFVERYSSAKKDFVIHEFPNTKYEFKYLDGGFYLFKETLSNENKKETIGFHNGDIISFKEEEYKSLYADENYYFKLSRYNDINVMNGIYTTGIYNKVKRLNKTIYVGLNDMNKYEIFDQKLEKGAKIKCDDLFSFGYKNYTYCILKNGKYGIHDGNSYLVKPQYDKIVFQGDGLYVLNKEGKKYLYSFETTKKED